MRALPGSCLGVILSLTGAHAYAGVPAQGSLLLAFQQDLADGEAAGPIIEDDASNSISAMALLSEFAADDNIELILGPTASSMGVPLARLANELKIPLGVTTAEPAIPAAGPWTFNVPADRATLTREFVPLAVDRLDIRRVVLLAARDHGPQMLELRIARECFRAGGVAIAREATVHGGDVDFSALLRDIALDDVDAVFIILLPPAERRVRDPGPAGRHAA